MTLLDSALQVTSPHPNETPAGILNVQQPLPSLTIDDPISNISLSDMVMITHIENQPLIHESINHETSSILRTTHDTTPTLDLPQLSPSTVNNPLVNVPTPVSVTTPTPTTTVTLHEFTSESVPFTQVMESISVAPLHIECTPLDNQLTITPINNDSQPDLTLSPEHPTPSIPRRQPYIQGVTNLQLYREVRYHPILKTYLYTPISTYTIGTFKTNLARTAAVRREQDAWTRFNESEKLPTHHQPPNMYEIPIVVDIYGKGPQVKLYKKKPLTILQRLAERQRFEYLTRFHAPKKIKGPPPHQYIATSTGIQRIDPIPLDSDSDSLSDTSNTQVPMTVYMNHTFESGYGYVFHSSLLHSHWSTTIPAWESHLLKIVERTHNILNDHIRYKAFEIYHPLRQRPQYITNLRHWLHLQLWTNPFFLRDITPSQQDRIAEDTDFDPLYPHLHWMRTEVNHHSLTITHPTNYQDPADEELTLIQVRQYQAQQVRQGNTLDIRVLQILNYIDKYNGDYDHRWSPALRQFIQLQRLLHLKSPTLVSDRCNAINTLYWLLDYARQGKDIGTIITHQDVSLSQDIVQWFHNTQIPYTNPTVHMMRTQCPHHPTEAPKCSDPIFDSGCSHHMWNHTAHFTTYIPNENKEFRAYAAFGHHVPVHGQGNIGPIHNVLYIPDLTNCLISSFALAQQGYEMRTGTNNKGLEAIIVKRSNPSEILLRGVAVNNLYRITRQEFERQLNLKPATCLVHMVTSQPLMHLHQILGHASAERCAYECKCHQFPGLQNMTSRSFQAIRECEECALAKSHRQPSIGHLDTPDFIGQTWYVDVKGPVSTPSIVNGNTYVFGIIEAKTKFLIQYFMKQKSDVLHYFKLFYDQFIPYVRALNPRIMAITAYSDMGEFHSHAVREYCQSFRTKTPHSSL